MHAALILLVVVAAPRGEPDHELSSFNKKEMASEATWVGVNSCMSSASSTMPQVSRDVLKAYCCCTIDAVRAKGTKGANMADFKVCADNAQSPNRKMGNLFDKRQWSSEAIIAAIDKCDASYNAEAKAKIGSVTTVWSFCACFVDAQRAHAGNPTVDDMQLCLQRARATYPPK